MDDDPRDFYWEIGKTVLLSLALVGLRMAIMRAVGRGSRKVFEEKKEEPDDFEYIDVDSW